MNVAAVFIGLTAAFSAVVGGQFDDNGLFFVENCPSRPCPVDCELSYTGGCPTCDCPEGQRCPAIECPLNNNLNAICQIGQKMDGCHTCVCDRRTYSIYYEDNNLERFVFRNGIPGAKESCQSYDIIAINKCLSPLREFHKKYLRKNPTLMESMHPWLFFELKQFGELCELVQRLPICTGNIRMERCKDQQPELSAMHTMYSLPCNEAQATYFDHFSCLHNTMVSHSTLNYCENQLTTQIHKASWSRYLQVTEKRQVKCQALNDFLDCTKPPLRVHCGVVAQELFSESFVRASKVTAPECTVERGRFAPVNTQPVRFVFQPKKDPFSGIPLRSSSQGNFSRNSNSPRNWRETFVEIKDPEIPGFRDNSVVHRTTQPPAFDPGRREKIQNLQTETIVANFRQRDMPVGLVAYHDIYGNLHVRGRCERVPPRYVCPDGSTIQTVIRWQRQLGTNVCTSYKYDYCGPNQEKLDLPVNYEQDCYKECFSRRERTSIDQIRNMRFKNGFQVRP